MLKSLLKYGIFALVIFVILPTFIITSALVLSLDAMAPILILILCVILLIILFRGQKD